MCAPQPLIETSTLLQEQCVDTKQGEDIVLKESKKHKTNNHNNKNNKKKSQQKSPNDKKKHSKARKMALKEKNRKITQQKQLEARLEAEQELSLDEQGRYLALDCEMVGIGEGGLKSALARVSIVDYNNVIIFDTYVKVNEPVTDYRTFVSGIREEHLQSDIAMDFAQCQSIVKKILHQKILVGHALKNDLHVLELEHPWHDCRDTAKYEPFMKKDKLREILRPRKLKDLAETKLNRIIQKDGQEHCPIEDAIAALDLYKKARVKWEKAMSYKMKRTSEITNDDEPTY